MRYFYPIAAIAIALLVCARLVSSWLQHMDCAKQGYTRTVDAGMLWPDIKCYKFANGSEVMR